MALAIYQKPLADEAGNVQANTSVEIRTDPGDVLATIYSDRDGLVPIANPTTSDDNGILTFYVAGGTYKITPAGADPYRYVAIGTAAEHDSGDFQGINTNLTSISNLTPSNDDFLQRKAGAWTNRTPAQALVDIAALPLAGGTLTGLLTTNGQIAFPSTPNPSADANVIDEYEEGTWTPTFTAQTTPPTSVTYTTQLGYYTKVGNIVSCWFDLVLSSKGSGGVGNIRLGGLPFTVFTSTSGIAAQGGAFTQVTLTAGYTWLTFNAVVTTTLFGVLEMGSAQTLAQVTWANCANNSRFMGNLVYKAAA